MLQPASVPLADFWSSWGFSLALRWLLIARSILGGLVQGRSGEAMINLYLLCWQARRPAALGKSCREQLQTV